MPVKAPGISSWSRWPQFIAAQRSGSNRRVASQVQSDPLRAGRLLHPAVRSSLMLHAGKGTWSHRAGRTRASQPGPGSRPVAGSAPWAVRSVKRSPQGPAWGPSAPGSAPLRILFLLANSASPSGVVQGLPPPGSSPCLSPAPTGGTHCGAFGCLLFAVSEPHMEGQVQALGDRVARQRGPGGGGEPAPTPATAAQMPPLQPLPLPLRASPSGPSCPLSPEPCSPPRKPPLSFVC